MILEVLSLTFITNKLLYFCYLKKIAVILLLFVYSTTTIGATVHVHFCMNKFVGWNLIQNENDKCSKCGMKEDATKKGCCKDEHKQLKINIDQQHSNVIAFTNVIPAPIILHPIFSYNFQINKFENVTNIYFHPPPLFVKQNLNVLYCNFLI